MHTKLKFCFNMITNGITSSNYSFTGLKIRDFLSGSSFKGWVDSRESHWKVWVSVASPVGGWGLRAQFHFPTKIQFLYCLLSSVALWGGSMKGTEEKTLEFRSADCWKMHFCLIFLGISEFYGKFWRKFDWKGTYNFPLCMFVSI